MNALKRILRPAFVALGLRPPPPPDPAALTELTEESIGRLLLRTDSGLGLFRLVHLLDAVGRGPAPKTILSIGSGLGMHEAFLALRFPEAEVVGVDIRKPKFLATLPNLRFVQGDLFDAGIRSQLPAADFVYSIECLEHIEDDGSIVAFMAAALMPGGRLWLLVPFASEAELADPELRRQECEQNEHVRPGYSAEGLRAMAERHGLKIESIEAAYRFPLQPFISAGVERISLALLLPRWRQVLSLIEIDVTAGLVTDRTAATAIKMTATLDTVSRS